MGLFSSETLELDIAGMTCANCVAHVTKALQAAPGTKKVNVSLAEEKAVVRGKDLDRDALIAAVAAAGYSAA